MSSIVENNVSGGVDLNSLTSGERYFYGIIAGGGKMLGGLRWADSGNIFLGADAIAVADLTPFNFSSVSQVVFGVHSDGNSSSRVRICIGSADKYVYGSPSNQTVTVDLSRVTEGTFLIQPSNPYYCWIELISYTTTDGKVHTASNLNY